MLLIKIIVNLVILSQIVEIKLIKQYRSHYYVGCKISSKTTMSNLKIIKPLGLAGCGIAIVS